MPNKNLNVVFRVDSSYDIGSGHVMRCLTLAEGIQKSMRANIFFICRDYSGAVTSLIDKQGFTVFMIEQNEMFKSSGPHYYSQWLGDEESEDARKFKSILISKRIHDIDLIITDHYGISSTWQKQVRSLTKKLVVLDDLGDRPHIADLLIDQTFKCKLEKYSNIVPSSCKFLLGTKYALLRPEFVGSGEEIIESRQKSDMSKILVMLGGTDPQNLCKQVLAQLVNNDSVSLVDIILSEYAKHKEEILNISSSHAKLRVHLSPTNISEIMRSNDLSIGAAGSSSWERCSQGIPGVVIIQAHNQLAVASCLKEEGVASVIHSDEVPSKLNDELSLWQKSKTVYLNAVKKSLEICDGKGVRMVVSEIKSLLDITDVESGVEVRPASIDDSRTLYEWANLPEIRKFSFRKNSFEYSQHLSWLERKLCNNNCHILIGEVNGKAIGQVRFDNINGQYEIDIHIGPEFQGKGYGKMLLNASIEELKMVSRLSSLKAVAFSNNLGSIALFSSSGFKRLPNKIIQGIDCAVFEREFKND